MSARILSPEEGMFEAISRLKGGGIVAFPTETVYGLGANALHEAAVAQIFAAKGRPASNPLIVHVPDVAAARELSADWPPFADELAARFWPGTLTLVVKKSPRIPDIVTAGGDTVGLRVPNHPVALQLLRATGLPLAAPSANRSEEVSPTTALHVRDSLQAFVDDLLILEGGACAVGLESTVLDMTTDPPHLLRPGMVSPLSLRSVTGRLAVSANLEGKRLPNGINIDTEVPRSPGQQKRHYAPHTPMTVLDMNQKECRSRLQQIAHNEGLIVFGSYSLEGNHVIRLPEDPREAAALLYAALRKLDGLGLKHIWVAPPPPGDAWRAIHDRLSRAATPAESGVREPKETIHE